MNFKHILGLAMLFAASGVTSVSALTTKLEVKEATIELAPGLKTSAWTFGGTVPGTPLIVTSGEMLSVEVTNKLKVSTSIHWHGVEVPNDQDGTAPIKPGQTFTYRFKVPASGTFWYHSHTAPVLEQVDKGLYGAFIVKAPEDSAYASDQTYILDDWYLGARGERLEGTARGSMERLGNVETVNGKTGEAIAALRVRQGELHKLRFINASTAAVHTLKMQEHQFRVTHTDGHPLSSPYLTDTLILQPGERLDVELLAGGVPGKRYEIRSTDRDLGLDIPVVYSNQTVAQRGSPFTTPSSKGFPGIAAKAPDFVLELNSRMASMGGMSGMDMGDHAAMNHGSSGGMMEWTINGKAFPATTPLTAKVGQIVKVRFANKDTAMSHPMDHPMHLHGTYFQVVSINGKAPERETWKDTISVPAGGSVEIAFQYKNAGDWMLHCHILDHEDSGMMTMVKVKA